MDNIERRSILSRPIPDEFKILIPAEAIDRRIAELAEEIDRSIPANDVPIMLCVLTGAFLFCSDLYRKFPRECHLQCVSAKSYEGTSSTQNVKFDGDLSAAKGRTVIVVEDIIDTGNTLRALVDRLRLHHPARIHLAALTYKDAERTRSVMKSLPVDCFHLGFEIPDQYVVGYGLDLDQNYRGLDGIYTIDPEKLSK